MPACRNCKQWHIRPDDVYCASCGALAVAFACEFGSHRVPVFEPGAAVPARVRVCNTGQAGVVIEAAAPHAGFARFEGLPPKTLRFGPGACVDLAFSATFDALPERPIEVQLRGPGNTAAAVRFFAPGDKPALACRLLPCSNGAGPLRMAPDGKLSIPAGATDGADIEVSNESGCHAIIAWGKAPNGIEILEKTSLVFAHDTRRVPCRVTAEAKAARIAGPIAADLAAVDMAQLPDFDALAEAAASAQSSADRERRIIATFQQTKVGTGQTLCEPEIAVLAPPELKLYDAGRGNPPPPLDFDPARNMWLLPLGTLMPTERRRVDLRLDNTGGQAVPLEGIHVPAGLEGGALRAAYVAEKRVEDQKDEEKKELAGGGYSIGAHLSVEAKFFPEGYRTEIATFDFGPFDPLRLEVKFTRDPGDAFHGALAIDFGTSYSCMAACRGRNEPAEVVRAHGQQGRYIPSVLYFKTPDDYLFGEPAKAERLTNPSSAVANLKRALTAEKVKVGDREYEPARLVRIMMDELLSDATKALGSLPSNIVITVPVGFSSLQREIIKGAIDNPDCYVRVVDEATAAAMHYYFMNRDAFRDGAGKRMLVFDFGGGTLDVAVLDVYPNRQTLLRRRGDPRLGGIDLDRTIAIELARRAKAAHPSFDETLVTRSRSQNRHRFEQNKRLLKLRLDFFTAAEQVKVAIGNGKRAGYKILVAHLLDAQGNAVANEGELEGEVTREELASLLRPKLERSVEVIGNALHAASLDKSQIDVVLMTGQVCRLECLRKSVAGYFGKREGLVMASESEGFDLKQCVALGAARHSFQLDDAGAEQESATSGHIGHFAQGDAGDRFEILLPDRTPYGVRSNVPLRLRLDAAGRRAPYELFCNLGPNERPRPIPDGDPDFIRIGYLKPHCPGHAGTEVEIHLAIDKLGRLEAWLDGTPVEIVPDREGLDDID